MRRLSLLGVLLLLLSACAGEEDPGLQPDDPPTAPSLRLDTTTPSADPAAPVAGDHLLAVDLPDDYQLRYLLHAPPSVERGRPMPLVLVFHGSGGTPEDMVRLTRLDALANDQGFLVVYPDNLADATAEIPVLLDHLAGLWPVDERRIYAAGFSLGASTTYLLAETLSDRIAAFAPVSGVDQDITLRGPAPLIAVEGREDEFESIFDQVNRQWARAAGCGPARVTGVTFSARPARRSVAECRDGSEHVVYRVEGMGHTWPRGGSQVIWRFFTAHALPR